MLSTSVIYFRLRHRYCVIPGISMQFRSIYFSSQFRFQKKSEYSFPEELIPFWKGLKRHERKDSVTLDILRERQIFRERIDEIPFPIITKKKLEKLNFGNTKRVIFFATIDFYSQNGAAKHLASACNDWPIFEHLLPEIAFAGHSNCGKSTLVNVLAGFPKRKGPAAVSDRAGWTDQICFYQLCKKPPILTLVDFPGYGHAVATAKDKKLWKEMTKDYLKQRLVLSRCCILVDCTRGLCREDWTMLRYLTKIDRDWQVILTKADLLNVEDLAKAVALIEWELLNELKIGTIPAMLWNEGNEQFLKVNNECSKKFSHRLLLPVSSSSGAGISNLWKELLKCARFHSVEFDSPVVESNVPSNSEVLNDKSLAEKIFAKTDIRNNLLKDSRVREHVNAKLVRKMVYLSKKGNLSISIETDTSKSQSLDNNIPIETNEIDDTLILTNE